MQGLAGKAFFNYYKTRILFCKIVKAHRSKINFFLQRDDNGRPDNEIKYILWGNYKDFSFRCSYSIGHPLIISMVCNKAETNLIIQHRMLQKLNLKDIYLNCYGLTIGIGKPFSPDKIIYIPEKFDLLIRNFSLLMSKPQEAI